MASKMFGLGLQRSASSQNANLRINVQDANTFFDSPLNSAASTASTLVDIEPFDEKHVFASKRAFGAHPPELAWTSSPPPRRKGKGRRSWLALPPLALVVVVYLVCARFRRAPPRPAQPAECNPFAERGWMHVNQSSIEGNLWQPFRPSCRPSSISHELRKAIPSASLAWLQDRTVVLIGDSVEAHHVQHFCTVVRGRLDHITSRHGASPPPFRNGRDEKFKEAGEHSEQLARPVVCMVEQYNFLLVGLQHYGMSTPEEVGRQWFNESPVYYSPFRLQDRIRHVLVPVLRAYKRHSVDLLSFASSFTDAAQLWQTQSSRGLRSTALDQDLIARYAERLGSTLVDLLDEDLLLDANILWRTAHVPKPTSGIPASVVLALDQVAQSVIEDLSTGAADGWWSSFAHAISPTQRSRLRIDHSGRMLQGQTTHLDDELHPAMLPNGKIWTDLILYELKRAIVADAP